jgi:outer membrane protein
MKKLIKIFIIVSFCILINSPSSLYGAHLLSLQEAIRLGLENSIKTSKINSENKKAGHRNTAKIFFPNLSTTLNTGIRYNHLKSAYNKSSDLTISIPINPIDKFFSYKKTSIEHMIKESEVSVETIEQINAIVLAYYKVVLEQQTLEVRKKSMEVSEYQKNEIKSTYDIGRESKLRYTNSLIQYNNDFSTYSQQEDALASAKLALCKKIGEKMDQDFYVDKTILLNNSINSDISEANITLSPRLNTKQHQIDMAKMKISVLWSTLLPSISARIGYDLNSKAKEWKENFTFGLSASLNIYEIINLSNELQCGNIDLDTSINDIAIEKLRLEMEFKTLVDLYNKQKMRHKLAQENLTLSLETFNIAQEQYRLGQISLLEYKEAKRNAETAELSTLSIMYQMKVSELNICALMGDKELLLRSCI